MFRVRLPHTTSLLSDGSHTFEVRATDPAGNADPSPADRNFTVDTACPETTITDGPTGAIGISPRPWVSAFPG
jgi:hypothetical protein